MTNSQGSIGKVTKPKPKQKAKARPKTLADEDRLLAEAEEAEKDQGPEKDKQDKRRVLTLAETLTYRSVPVSGHSSPWGVHNWPRTRRAHPLSSHSNETMIYSKNVSFSFPASCGHSVDCH